MERKNLTQKNQIKKDKKDDRSFVAASICNRELNNRGGSAIHEHLKGYDNLKKISQYKKHPDYYESNLNQHAGYAAEELHVRRTNVDNILEGRPDRIERTDNVGLNNHPQHDFVKVDKNGNVIKDKNGNIIGAGQSKFNKNPEKTAYELSKRSDYKGDKYVPADQYEEVKKIAKEKYREYLRQSKELEKQGRYEEAAKKREIAENYKHTAENVKPAKTTKNESVESVKSPEKITIKDIGKTSLKVGTQAAKVGGGISGGMSLIRNGYEVVKGEKEVEDAVIEVVKDTGKGAIKSGATSVVTSGLKGTAEKIAKEKSGEVLGKVAGKIAKGNTATYIVTGAIEAGGTIKKYLNDEITGKEAAKELTEKAGGMAGSVAGAEVGAAIGTMICPGVGTALGGLIGGGLGAIGGSKVIKGILSIFD